LTRTARTRRLYVRGPCSRVLARVEPPGPLFRQTLNPRQPGRLRTRRLLS